MAIKIEKGKIPIWEKYMLTVDEDVYKRQLQKKIHLEQKLAGLQFLLQIEMQRILFCSSVW